MHFLFRVQTYDLQHGAAQKLALARNVNGHFKIVPLFSPAADFDPHRSQLEFDDVSSH